MKAKVQTILLKSVQVIGGLLMIYSIYSIPGDSGAPLFVRYKNGDTKYVGMHLGEFFSSSGITFSKQLLADME